MNPDATSILRRKADDGFAALIDGTAQIGMSSRPAKPTEMAGPPRRESH
jgi:hypothetical protein